MCVCTLLLVHALLCGCAECVAYAHDLTQVDRFRRYARWPDILSHQGINLCASVAAMPLKCGLESRAATWKIQLNFS